MISANLEKVNGQYMIVVRDYTNNPLEYKPGIIKSYSAADNRNRKIICFYTMYINFARSRGSGTVNLLIKREAREGIRKMENWRRYGIGKKQRKESYYII